VSGRQDSSGTSRDLDEATHHEPFPALLTVNCLLVRTDFLPDLLLYTHCDGSIYCAFPSPDNSNGRLPQAGQEWTFDFRERLQSDLSREAALLFGLRDLVFVEDWSASFRSTPGRIAGFIILNQISVVLAKQVPKTSVHAIACTAPSVRLRGPVTEYLGLPQLSSQLLLCMTFTAGAPFTPFARHARD
jgi:hypothetical protein